ncbi:hypothetical protein M3D75_14595 [Microbacterium enclense]|uniref:hypothetical protein n=1 Tax=Microbacterium enclense TaxID=993073 RepID=UPI0021A3B5CF|nr:hypothetical protein [Microbacterium enclense]MCT2087349.1 hypothetical protein [Microbacterium enclense]
MQTMRSRGDVCVPLAERHTAADDAFDEFLRSVSRAGRRRVAVLAEAQPTPWDAALQRERRYDEETDMRRRFIRGLGVGR